MIVSAAVKLFLDDHYEKIITIPVHRHKDARIIAEKFGYKPWHMVDGFFTDTGKFLDRLEAADHAYECGQLIEDAETERISILMSEDLW